MRIVCVCVCVCVCVINSPLHLDFPFIQKGTHGSGEASVLVLQSNDDWLRQHGGVHHLVATDNHGRNNDTVHTHRWALRLWVPLTEWESETQLCARLRIKRRRTHHLPFASGASHSGVGRRELPLSEWSGPAPLYTTATIPTSLQS